MHISYGFGIHIKIPVLPEQNFATKRSYEPESPSPGRESNKRILLDEDVENDLFAEIDKNIKSQSSSIQCTDPQLMLANEEPKVAPIEKLLVEDQDELEVIAINKFLQEINMSVFKLEYFKLADIKFTEKEALGYITKSRENIDKLKPDIFKILSAKKECVECPFLKDIYEIEIIMGFEKTKYYGKYDDIVLEIQSFVHILASYESSLKVKFCEHKSKLNDVLKDKLNEYQNITNKISRFFPEIIGLFNREKHNLSKYKEDLDLVRIFCLRMMCHFYDELLNVYRIKKRNPVYFISRGDETKLIQQLIIIYSQTYFDSDESNKLYQQLRFLEYIHYMDNMFIEGPRLQLINTIINTYLVCCFYFSTEKVMRIRQNSLNLFKASFFAFKSHNEAEHQIAAVKIELSNVVPELIESYTDVLLLCESQLKDSGCSDLTLYTNFLLKLKLMKNDTQSKTSNLNYKFICLITQAISSLRLRVSGGYMDAHKNFFTNLYRLMKNFIDVEEIN